MGKYKEFITNIFGLFYKANKDTSKAELCEHILKGLPKEIFYLIMISDITLKISNLLRSENNVRKEIEK